VLTRIDHVMICVPNLEAAAGARYPQYRRAGDPGRAGSGLWRLYRFRGPGV